ncbi:MAG TPA: secretin N-terminal domain-containing protein [Candidatus Aquilonibacter sp.]|nr:secretin N-terminal domain-containing protein [Candidatus Aquilonibacter sp.]
MRRLTCAVVLALAVVLAGCPKGNQDYDAGRKAEALQDYDTALVNYERALRADPTNTEYKLRETHVRFEAGEFHVDQGEKALKQGDLQLALGEFQKAVGIDPSNAAADQELKRTMDLIAAKNAAEAPKVNPNPPDDSDLLAAPPELKPLSREPINLKMTRDAKAVFETIGKLAGVSVIFDPDFTSRQISVDLPNITLEEALDAVSFESKAFWKPLTANVILVAPDNPQKRRDLEDEEVQTIYLSNTLTPQDLTEVVTTLRQLLDIRRISQVNSQNAIVIRDTPDRIELARKIVRDMDKAKPEVLIHVQVLTASVNRMRDLGINPGQTVTLGFTPRTSVQPNGGSTSSGTSSSSTSTSATQITLENLKNLGTADYALALPGAVANAILTDNQTRIIQDPEVRVSDGEKATLKVGERVPIATGSFQAGVGVGVGGGAGIVNPLVNTQFTYQDVGVSIDVQPRVHPDGDVSMHVAVEVSEIDGEDTIGGIQQPVIGQRKVDHDIRLKDGEVSILGGLMERTDTKAINGIPGLANLPLLRYLFSDNNNQVQENEVLIVLTPHVIRFPSISAENLRTLAAGTDTNARVYRDDEFTSAPANGTGAQSQSPLPSTSQALAQPGAPAAQLHFDPPEMTLQVGERQTIALAVSNVNDLYSIPLLIHYDPAVIQVEEVRDGGFLHADSTQEIAIVQRIDPQQGQVIVSATRPPNTPGVNGSGTLLGLVVRGVGHGKTALQILQVNARNSQQQTIPIVSGEANIVVP